MEHRRLSWLAGLATTLALFGATAVPAQAAPTRATTATTYAALGDSFAAGWGAGQPINQLGQTAQAYPVQLAGRDPANVTFTAVAMGGTTQTVLAQVPLIPRTAKRVTLTIGGNDLDFVGTVTTCLAAPDACDLSTALGKLKDVRRGLSTAIAAIHKQAPRATIHLTGYPLLFQARGATCTVGTAGTAPLVVPASVTHKLDAATALLNLTILSTTFGKAGKYTRYVDVTKRFLGHGVCGTGTSPNPNAWLNPVGLTDPEPVTWLHPNSKGQRAYAAAVKASGFRATSGSRS